MNPLISIEGIERQAPGRYNLNGKSVVIRVSEQGQVQVRMGATWEAIANYLKIGVQKIEASFDELASDDLNSSGQKLKKKKKAKGK